MFGFFKKINDNELTRQFVKATFLSGKDFCRGIADGVRISSNGTVSFPVNDNTVLEVSVAILGTCLAVLKGYSKIMTVERATHIESFSKRSIEKDFELSSDSAAEINLSLDEYQDVFCKAVHAKTNPFGEIAGEMLVRCLGEQANALCIKETGGLNPITHHMVGDYVTIVVTGGLKYWKKN